MYDTKKRENFKNILKRTLFQWLKIHSIRPNYRYINTVSFTVLSYVDWYGVSHVWDQCEFYTIIAYNAC